MVGPEEGCLLRSLRWADYKVDHSGADFICMRHTMLNAFTYGLISLY